MDGVFKMLFDYFKAQSESFYAKETHRSNTLGIDFRFIFYIYEHIIFY